MPLTEWDDRYILGIEEIDEHHRKLIELLNKAYNLILYSTDKGEIETILTELTEYTDYHFNAEEQMMKKIGYAGLDAQVSNHNSFKKQLSDLMQNHLSGAPHVNTDVVLFLWDWLGKHILKDDKEWAAYLSQKCP
jgi:hemerythrin-like metal-binding protein